MCSESTLVLEYKWLTRSHQPKKRHGSYSPIFFIINLTHRESCVISESEMHSSLREGGGRVVDTVHWSKRSIIFLMLVTNFINIPNTAFTDHSKDKVPLQFPGCLLYGYLVLLLNNINPLSLNRNYHQHYVPLIATPLYTYHMYYQVWPPPPPTTPRETRARPLSQPHPFLMPLSARHPCLILVSRAVWAIRPMMYWTLYLSKRP